MFNLKTRANKPDKKYKLNKSVGEYNPKLGFIILRHVNSVITNLYWIKCYDSIRTFYPENKIIILDDNSNYKFITKKELYNTEIIQSEFPKRGELLPYYYYAKNKWFDIAFILHDSVFLQSYIHVNVDKYSMIWCFNHESDDVLNETRIIKLFNNPELTSLYKNKKWVGCFGGMTIITHDFVSHLQNKYNFDTLLPVITNRKARCCFERIIACLLQKEHKPTTLLGNIHKYCPWGITSQNAMQYPNLPLLKIWSGR
jgi:hypothetical protein